MKKRVDFFSHFSGVNKKGRPLTFCSNFSGEEKYAGRYDHVITWKVKNVLSQLSRRLESQN